MIESFEAENFKVFNRFQMRGITPLTLVSGHNNAGKTSLLEALFLFFDHRSPEVFAKLCHMRSGYVEAQTRIWEPLFHKLDVSEGMKLRLCTNEKKEASLIFKKDHSFVPSTKTAPSPEMMGQLLSSVRSSYSLEFEYVTGDYRETGHFSASPTGILLNIDTSLEHNEQKPMKWTLLIHSTAARATQDLVEWIGNLEIQGKKETALEVLRLFSPDIQDVFSASQNGLVQLYVKGKNGVIPLKYAGDGMIRLLYIMAAIVSNPNSLILIDEIENGFHYSVYEELWRMLATIAKDNCCQIIATSHSYENIQSAYEGVKAAKQLDAFSLHRLERRDDSIVDNCYEADLIEAALDANMEVR